MERAYDTACDRYPGRVLKHDARTPRPERKNEGPSDLMCELAAQSVVESILYPS